MMPEVCPMAASHARAAKAGNSNHFIDNVRDALLRGGRLNQWKGKGAVSGAAGPDARHLLREKSNDTGGEGQDACGLSTPITATHKRVLQ
jgi:hypothetical protein